MLIDAILGNNLSVNQILEYEDIVTRLSPREFVYISGSLVEGLGNKWSDVDVFVVGDLAPLGTGVLNVDSARVINHTIGDRRVDFEFVEQSHVETIINKLNSFDGNASVHSGGLLSTSDQKFLHLLRVGIPVCHNENHNKILATLDVKNLSQYLRRVAYENTNGCFEDLCGMVESQDFAVALLRSRDLISFATDVLLHHQGSTNPSTKWRIKILTKMAETFDREDAWIPNEYWRLMFFSEINDKKMQMLHFEECLKYSEKIIRRVYG